MMCGGVAQRARVGVAWIADAVALFGDRDAVALTGIGAAVIVAGVGHAAIVAWVADGVGVGRQILSRNRGGLCAARCANCAVGSSGTGARAQYAASA